MDINLRGRQWRLLMARARGEAKPPLTAEESRAIVACVDRMMAKMRENADDKYHRRMGEMLAKDFP